MSRMGRAILVGLGFGLALTAVVWGIEYALGAPKDVYGVSEIACLSVACLYIFHRYSDEILGPKRGHSRRG
jgi:hypothetical protein